MYPPSSRNVTELRPGANSCKVLKPQGWRVLRGGAPFARQSDVERIPNRSRPPAILLHQSRREDGKVKRTTLANLSRLPPRVNEDIRLLLKRVHLVVDPAQAITIHRSLPHGHVQAVLGLCQPLGLRRILHRHPGRPR